MNTKLLKQKILDLAIRGKLTQQLESDGTAADLLKEICDRTQEKTSLRAKRGNPSPQTIIPLDKSEAPFEIPANWEWVRLGDLCELLNGDRSSNYPNKNEYVVCGVAWINTGHIRPDGFLDEKTMNYITEEKYNSLGNGKIHKFDLVYCLRGATFGKVARVEPFEKGAIASSLMIIRPILSQMRDFLYRCLKTDFAMNQLRKFDNGSAQPNLAAKDVSRYFVPLPPLTEQQRIVEKVQEAFAEIDSIENNKELLKTHIKQARQKILDLAIHGKLVPQNKTDGTARELLSVILSEAQSAKSKDLKKVDAKATRDNPHYEKLSDIPFEIPDSWEWVKLGDVGKWQSGTTPSKSNSSYYKDGTIPWLNTGDLNDGIIREIPKKVTEKALAETSLRLNEAGSVCIAMYGATIGKIGILSMPATTNQACCVCNNLKNFVNQMWLFYFLKNHKQEFIEAGFGGAQPNISKEKITATLFPLPPLAEQKRIVNKIEEIFASLDAISRHLD